MARNMLGGNRPRKPVDKLHEDFFSNGGKGSKPMTMLDLIKRELAKKPLWWWALNAGMIAGLTYAVLGFSLAVF